MLERYYDADTQDEYTDPWILFTERNVRNTNAIWGDHMTKI